MSGDYKPGDIILGKWRLVRLIGAGSYGRVFEAHREDFGTTYKAAIKIITIPQNANELKGARAEGMDDNSLTAYFRSLVEEIVKEVSLMSQLKGTAHIVSYEDHDVIPHDDGLGWDIFIRMELLTPLLDYIVDHALAPRDIVKLGIDICKALELCMKLDIIHRDIKPENIMVSALGDFKLGDFGIARTVEKTMSGLSRKGTFTYMAPEIYLDGTGTYGPSIDIYSLGIVLYRLLNDNRSPFLPEHPAAITHSDREDALMRRISGTPLPAPRNADKRLAKIVLKACAFDSKDRYSNPMHMRQELEAVCNRDKMEYSDLLNDEALLKSAQISFRGQADSGKTIKLYVDEAASDQAEIDNDVPPPKRQYAKQWHESVVSNRNKKHLTWTLPGAGLVIVAATVIIFAFSKQADGNLIDTDNAYSSATHTPMFDTRPVIQTPISTFEMPTPLRDNSEFMYSNHARIIQETTVNGTFYLDKDNEPIRAEFLNILDISGTMHLVYDDSEGDKIASIYKDNELLEEFSGNFGRSQIASSLDGSSIVYYANLTDNEQSIQDWSSHGHSRSGDLMLHRNSSTIMIDNNVISGDAVTISPDGKIIIYIKVDDAGSKFSTYMFTEGGSSIKIGENQWPIAVSNGKEFFYYVQVNQSSGQRHYDNSELFVSKEDENTKLYSFSGTEVLWWQMEYKFNYDLSEVIFAAYHNTSYIYANSLIVNMFDDNLYMDMYCNLQSYGILSNEVYGVKSFARKIMRDGYDIYFINDQYKAEMIVEEAEYPFNIVGNEILVYLKDGNLYSTSADMNGSQNILRLNDAANVIDYELSHDGLVIYYCTEGGELWYLNRETNEQKMTAQGIYDFYLISGTHNCYLSVDTGEYYRNQLFYSENGLSPLEVDGAKEVYEVRAGGSYALVNFDEQSQTLDLILLDKTNSELLLSDVYIT